VVVWSFSHEELLFIYFSRHRCGPARLTISGDHLETIWTIVRDSTEPPGTERSERAPSFGDLVRAESENISFFR
jgi:hypothetical protein